MVGHQRCLRTTEDEIQVRQMNAIINHSGVQQITSFTHSRSAHNLLGYRVPYTTFSERTNIVHWIGPRPKDSEKYRLFQRKDQRRIQRRTTGKSSDLDTDTEAGSRSRIRRLMKKGKASATGATAVVATWPFNSNALLRISEPGEAVTVVVPPLA